MIRSQYRAGRAALIASVVVVALMISSNLAWASTVQRANQFIDTLVREIPGEAARTGELDPLPLGDFTVKVKSNGPFNRNFTADFTSCTLRGLFTHVQRIGDASGPGIRDGEVTVGANLELAGTIDCDGTVRGDTFSGGPHKIRTSTTVIRNAISLAEFAAPPQADSFRLVTFQPSPPLMNTFVVQGKVRLNRNRTTSLILQQNQNLANQFAAAARDRLGPVMNTVAFRLSLPQS